MRRSFLSDEFSPFFVVRFTPPLIPSFPYLPHLAECKADFDSAHMRKLEALEYRSKLHSNSNNRAENGDICPSSCPFFVTRPKERFSVAEGKNVHFEAKLEPIADSALQVEWLRDGEPVTVGHRFRPIHDFGYVALDIVGAIEEDSGKYTCRAVNDVGHAEFQLDLNVHSKICFWHDFMNSLKKFLFCS